jgi:hypothetical protein
MTIDLEGLEKEEKAVIDAICKGVQSAEDRGIHPDQNGPSRPIPKPEFIKTKTTWIEKIKLKINAIRKKDDEIYPLF